MERLFGEMERFADRVALVDENDRLTTYADLLALADELTRPLAGARRLVVLEMANALAPIAAYVGAVRAGHAVVLTAEGAASPDAPLVRNFPPEFVLRRTGDGWAFVAGGGQPVAVHEDLAVLLSTSGSTGSPKLVRLSHGNLISNAASICEYLQIGADERAITSLPPFYSYGMSVLNSHLQAGAGLVLSDQSVTDADFWTRFDKHGATSFAGVPHTFELLERNGFLEAAHPTLRYFTQAGGKLAPEKVRLFARHAADRGRRFYVMYGQTEASPRIAYVPPDEVAENPHVIGVAIPGGELRIDGGELVYRGPNVMMGYALSPADLARGPETAELRTGDLAERTAQGHFRIVGRTSRFAKIFGLRIGLDEVESLVREAGGEGVAAGDDEGLVLALTRGRPDEVARRVAARIKLPPSRIFAAELAELPRLPSGKIDYPAVLRLRTARAARVSGDLRSQLLEILGVESASDDDTFVDLGGDSLSYVQASMVLEEQLGEAPEGWEEMTLAELEQLVPVQPGRWASVESGILVRAAAILLVVFNHVAAAGLGGAATALLIVTGLNFSRFQRPKLEKGGSGALARTTLLRVALPYMLVISVYFAALGQVFWPQYLLFANFTDGLIIDGQRRFQIYWYVEVYVSLVLALCALFLIPQVRQLSRARPQAFALAAFSLALGLGVATRAMDGPGVFNERTTLSLAYVFAYGWLIDRFRSLKARLALAALGAGLLAFLPPDDVAMAAPVAGAAIALLLFVRRVPLGPWPAKAASTIAAASLYIYIFHGPVIQASRIALGDPLPTWAVPIVWTGCIALGLGLWRVTEFATSSRGREMAAAVRVRTVGRLARLARG